MLVVALVAAACGNGDGTPPPGSVAAEAVPATEAPEVGTDSRAAVTTTVPTPVARSVGDPAEPDTPATTATPRTTDVDVTVDALVEDSDALAGIGGSGAEAPATTTTTLPSSSEEASLEVVVSEDVPDMELLDLSTGSMVSLRSVVAGETPLLFWFWSPL